MNVSNINCAPNAIPLLPPPEKQKQEAQEYFKELYGEEIKYDIKDDVFIYRSLRFNYFCSGVSHGHKCSYILIDNEDSTRWLFTYGDLEVRWSEYVRDKAIKDLGDEATKTMSTWWEKVKHLIK